MNNKANGFIRNKLNWSLNLLDQTEVKEPLLQLSGSTPFHYFFKTKDPFRIIMSDHNLNIKDTFTYNYTINRNGLYGFDLKIDSPVITLYSRNLSARISWEFKDTTAKILKLAPPLFTRMVLLSSGNIVLRGFDSVGRRQLVEKIDYRSGKIIAENEIFDTRKDAGFSTDGMLTYDSLSNKLLYVQYYQNQFYCLDTNLSILYKSKTIDTVSTNPVITKEIKNGDATASLMPSVPLQVTNKECVTHNGLMYILSNLRADNDSKFPSSDYSPIDIYNVNNGTYKGSIYIPNINGEKINNFIFIDNLLIVIYKYHIAKYKIDGV